MLNHWQATVWNQPKAPTSFFSAKIFANVRRFRLGFDQRACGVHLQHFLLSMSRLIRFDAPLQRFLGRMGPASSAQDSASALRDGGPGAVVRSSQLCAFHRIYHPLCPHPPPRWAEAASFLHGVCSRDSTFSRFHFARHRRFRRGPDSVCDALTGRRVVAADASDHA